MSSEPPSTAHPPPPNQNTTTTNPDTNPDTEMPDSASPSPQDADAASEEKATPPPPPPPVPGPRAARLQALFATTARHSLDKISKENFAACFPTVASRAPGTLEFVQRQMVERLGGLWNVRLLSLLPGWIKLGWLKWGWDSFRVVVGRREGGFWVVLVWRSVERGCYPLKKGSQLTTPQKEFEAIMANRQVVARLNELESLVADATRRRLEAPDPTSPPVAYAFLPLSLPFFPSSTPHH